MTWVIQKAATQGHQSTYKTGSAADIPVSDWVVKGGRTTKHACKGCNRNSVPRSNGCIKRWVVPEQVREVCDFRDSPIVHKSPSKKSRK